MTHQMKENFHHFENYVIKCLKSCIFTIFEPSIEC